LRLLQEQRDGRASLEWYWVNPTTGARELVRPLVLESAAKADGPYAMDATAMINPDAKTVVVPRSGNARFYRLRSSTAYSISGISLQGGKVMMSYQ